MLFPIAQKYLADKHIVERLLNEHDEMRTLVNFFRKPNEKELEAKLKLFGKILEQHIRCEEQDLFPLCEQKIPADLWKDIESTINQHRPRKQNESNNQ